VLRTATSPSSLNSKTALEKVVARCGTDIAVVTDNGSENMGKAGKFPAAAEITQYRTRPYAPKEKPHIGRFMRRYAPLAGRKDYMPAIAGGSSGRSGGSARQLRWRDYHYEPVNATEPQALADDRLEKYHFYRPREAPGGLTPAEFSAALGISIPHSEVSYM